MSRSNLSLFTPGAPPLSLEARRTVVIGRGPECDLVIGDEDGASRRHAELVVRDGAWIIRDLRSKNGTHVNDELVIGQRRLRPGDRIEVGETTILFCEDPEPGAPGPGEDANTRTLQIAPRTAMLFSPPAPPLRIDTREGVVIGRSSSCDFVLREEEAASRTHAEIRRERDGHRLADLGSSNGTYLNGKRLRSERLLEPGDRIGIGARTITYCEIQAEATRDATEKKTTIFSLETSEPKAPSVVFTGDLSEIPLFAALQVLELGANSGILHVITPASEGRMWLDEGVPVHAETSDREGLEAILLLLRATLGRFEFESGAAPAVRSIDQSLTSLLLESSRRFDEVASAARRSS